MPPGRGHNDGLLARVNFPLYAVEMLTSRHVLVAGGGGSSKTGVANGFEIYEIYHNGQHFVAEEIVRHETGANVVMNFAVRNSERRSYLLAGQESHCQMYLVHPRIVIEGEEDVVNGKKRPAERPNENGVRRRGPAPEAENGPHERDIPLKDDSNVLRKRLRFDIKASDSIQTDFLSGEPLQRVVRISPDGCFMATGGTDGHLRVWTFPQMVKKFVFKGHTKEIDDIDVSPDSKFIVTISKDGLGTVVEANSGKLHYKLTWETPDGSKYLYKRCRYGTVEASRDHYRLFTISNPLGKVGKQRGYLQQWNSTDGTLKLALGIDESLASLAVRDDGRFVAVGTMFSGSVSIYIAFSLQRVLHIPNAHSMFVTGLEFLPSTDQQGPPISSDTEVAVLSISVDNRVCIHSLQYRHTVPFWIAIIAIIIVIFCSFFLCSYIGL